MINGGGILYTEPIRSVLFTHQSHIVENKLTCDECHSGLFEMEALKVQGKKDFNMESLYKGKYCGACHNGKKAFASDSQCARCHIRVSGFGPRSDIPVYRASEYFGKDKRVVHYNHKIHTKKFRCTTCHPALFKIKKGANRITMADHGRKQYCFSCHDGTMSFSWMDCSRCHTQMPTPKKNIYFGANGKAVPFSHSAHLTRMKCGDCHIQIFPFKEGSTKIAYADHVNSKACFTCHKEKNGVSFYKDCSRCHKDRSSMAAPQGPLTYTSKDKGPVAFNHSSHAFSCDVCHPNLFVMKKGGTKITMIDMYQGKSCGTCHNRIKTFTVTDCSKCHKKE